MAEQHKAQGRAGTRIGTWTGAGAGLWPGTPGLAAPWRWPWVGLAGRGAARLRAWAAAEVAPGRLMPWLPVGFGFGIVLYFAAEREPVWWIVAATAAAAIVAAAALRARPIGFPVALGCAAVAAGFATATLKTRWVEHPVLRSAAYGVSLTGFVERREELERSDRIVVRIASIEAARLTERPERVRLSVRKGAAPPVGAFISAKARLNPPASPFRPGGYDLARDLYFQKIGATGLASGTIKTLAPPVEAGWWLRFATAVEGIRDAIDSRIRAAVKGDTGSIASALITGKRDTLTGTVFDAMYVSGVGHVLSISGFHMALVAGVVLFVVRAGLALIPGLALNHPIKKWAALAAFVAATFYLVLSGAEVATQRSYIMIAVVLVGVLADRPTLTMRTIAVAALVVMLLVPEAVIHPSFQMSFAATLALIAVYERGLPWIAAGGATSLGARLALWGAREITVSILASLVAGLATLPFVAFHFHRIGPYGVIANLLAMPVISALSMPAGLLALVAMPFGFDGPLWRLMGAGIDWMIMVALWVAALPGAVGRVPAFGEGALLFGSAGLIVLCLLRTPLRLAGAGLAALGCVAAMMAARPDILVSAAGDVVAVRGQDGRLSAVKFGGDTLSIREWLAADADERLPTDRTVAAGFACDPDGCVAKLRDGTAVAVSRTPAALADDCARAAVMVTNRGPPPGCAAMVLDRRTLQASGAVALTYRNGAFAAEPARPDGLDRPWAQARAPQRGPPASAATLQTIAPQTAAPQTTTLQAAPSSAIDAAPAQPDADAEQ